MIVIALIALFAGILCGTSCGGGFQPHRLADLPHGGRISLPGDHLLQIGVDLVCHLGFLRHNGPSCGFRAGKRRPRAALVVFVILSHAAGKCNVCSLIFHFPALLHCAAESCRKFFRISSCNQDTLMVS